MKPIRFLSPVAEWLMRSGILFFVIFYYLKVIKVMNFSSVMFWVSLGFLIFSVLLFTGGFLRKTPLTVISALVLTLLTGYQAFIFVKSGIDYNFAVFVILGSVFVHFLAKGNNS
jgi:hypothetical protein